MTAVASTVGGARPPLDTIGITEHASLDPGREGRKARARDSRLLRRSLRVLGENERADKVASCGKVAEFACAGCDGRVAKATFRCDYRLCPWCLRRKALERAGDILAHVLAFDHPHMVTLTVKNSTNLELMELSLTRSFRKLKRTSWWRARFLRGFCQLDCTYNHAAGEWHLHMHIIAEAGGPLDLVRMDGARWWGPDSAALSEAWLELTGDSFIVDIRPVPRGDRGAIYELCKYPVKTSDILSMPGLVAEYEYVMAGRRQFFTFGFARGDWRSCSPGAYVRLEKLSDGTYKRTGAVITNVGEAATVTGQDTEFVAEVYTAPAECPYCGLVESMLPTGRTSDRADWMPGPGGWLVPEWDVGALVHQTSAEKVASLQGGRHG